MNSNYYGNFRNNNRNKEFLHKTQEIAELFDTFSFLFLIPFLKHTATRKITQRTVHMWTSETLIETAVFCRVRMSGENFPDFSDKRNYCHNFKPLLRIISQKINQRKIADESVQIVSSCRTDVTSELRETMWTFKNTHKPWRGVAPKNRIGTVM